MPPVQHQKVHTERWYQLVDGDRAVELHITEHDKVTAAIHVYRAVPEDKQDNGRPLDGYAGYKSIPAGSLHQAWLDGGKDDQLLWQRLQQELATSRGE